MASYGESVTRSELEDILIDFEDKSEAKYEALESFTIRTLKEQNEKFASFEERLKFVEDKIESSHIETLDDSVSSLREEFDQLKNKSPASCCSPGITLARFEGLNKPCDRNEDETANMSTALRSPVKKKTKVHSLFAGRFYGSSQRSPPSPPKYLDDLQDDNLRAKLKRYYDPSKMSSAEKLYPVQLAYVMYFFAEVKRGEFSARSDVLTDLIARGVEKGMWFATWAPENIKGTFREYLKEKVRNLNKKKMQAEATGELLEKMIGE